MELIVLGSGSSGNCAVVRASGTTILVDAGLSARKTIQRLSAAGIDAGEIDAVLLTHEHGDHTSGLPVLLKSLRCPVYASRLTADEVRGSDPRNAEAEWRLFATGSTFAVATIEVTAFSVPHDAADPAGFTLRCEGLSLGILTDLGHATASVIHHVSGAHCLFVEANHDEKMLQEDVRRPFSIKQRILSPHGHLSNRAAADLVRRAAGADLQSVVLGHLSSDCNTPALAIAAVAEALEAAGVVVSCAEREIASPALPIG